MGNWLFDYLALLAALTAVGSRPRPSLVLLAYVAAALLGMIPITPGGLGFVEAGLAATLALAGVSGRRCRARDAGVPARLLLDAAGRRPDRVCAAPTALREARRGGARDRLGLATRKEREQLAEVGDAGAAPVLALGRERRLGSTGGSAIRYAVIPTAAAPVSSPYAPSPQYRHAAGSTPSASVAYR